MTRSSSAALHSSLTPLSGGLSTTWLGLGLGLELGLGLGLGLGFGRVEHYPGRAILAQVVATPPSEKKKTGYSFMVQPPQVRASIT